jgi:putative membrane-bound dehydrogenase-like protein
MKRALLNPLAAAVCAAILQQFCHANEPNPAWLVGTAKIDVTPIEPVRMAGYGSRNHPSEGIDTPLYARCVALKSRDNDQPASLLLSVDTIGLPGSMTRQLAEQIADKHQTPRDRIVFCSTHTHCGPDLVSELSNIFATELSEDETAAGQRYRAQLQEGILLAVDRALGDMTPASLSYAVGTSSFAANRRVLTGGRWTGFGVQPDGPVDHTVPVLRARGVDGAMKAVVFNYACHCTTLGGDHYRINADWAGYASESLEAEYPKCVALCTIGCGADANPNPRGSMDATKLHGRTLAAEVKRMVAGDMQRIDAPLTTRFDYAGLSFDLPTTEELQQRENDASQTPQARRHAKQLLEVYRHEGRLPATYPVPIQAWRFGDQLTMVFLGGEVVVDYSLRLKQTLNDANLWVTAYANDVLGYIASERMRAEGGYEFDRSGVYYGLPGPWATGTEDFLIQRVKELIASRGRSQPLAAAAAAESFKLDARLSIDLVVSEPLVQDPINLAFGGDGRLWVVEMADYPLDENGGRVKVLSDEDGDGVYETSTLFLSGIPFPTGVQPWRDGAIIASAPDILMARDTDGDGKADDVQKMYTGFRLANPQHRISGFTYGLDHSLHCSSGDNLSEITSTVTGTTVNASGHDLKIWPDDGRLATVSGRTQYIRSRNDWGQWFGNDNSRPMYHFPIDSSYLKRNPAVAYSGNTQQLFDPPVAPPVFPQTSATERFNDLFAANRFTSACSSIVFRGSAFGGSEHNIAFICEPVHNLVHRAILQPGGATFRAARHSDEQASEFLASTDPWFRPTRAITGPDGALWIVDMYRETIEHPEWIPQAWQQQLDLRAGEDRGRIYRVSDHNASGDDRWKTMQERSTTELVRLLRSDNGMLRDMAQRLIVHRGDRSAVPMLKRFATDAAEPQARVHALSILAAMNELDSGQVLSALADDHPGVLQVAVRLCEPMIADDPALIDRLRPLATHSDPTVVLQTALALGQTDAPAAGEILATIAVNPHLDPWVARAVSTSARPHAIAIASRMIDEIDSVTNTQNEALPSLLSDVLKTARAGNDDLWELVAGVLTRDVGDLDSRLRLVSFLSDALKSNAKDQPSITRSLQPLYQQALVRIRDAGAAEDQRCRALGLIGLGIAPPDSERALLVSLITPASPPQVQKEAINHLTRSSDTSASDDLLDRWQSMSKSVRDHCVSRMLERSAWSESLLTALEEKRIGVSDLAATAREQLSRSGSRSMRVRADRLIKTSGSTQKQQLVRSYLSQFDAQRDRSNGAALFKKHCAVCHVPDSRGRATGASLENLSDRRDRVLVEAILDPNRAVDPKYQNYLVQTGDDRILSGVIEEEAGTSITLAHADGKRTTLNRSDIALMKNSGISLMPEGLEELLSPAAIQDIIHYLQQGMSPEEATK